MTPYDLIDTALGPLLVAGSDADGIVEIRFLDGEGAARVDGTWRRDPAVLARARGQLAAYFRGERRDFDLHLKPRGTPFQRQVWAAVATVPWGQTATYGEIAAAIGRPTASRAVGAANGANPLPVVVPCHRIIGTSGKLTGYRGGLRLKRWLLAHEGASVGPTLAAG